MTEAEFNALLGAQQAPSQPAHQGMTQEQFDRLLNESRQSSMPTEAVPSTPLQGTPEISSPQAPNSFGEAMQASQGTAMDRLGAIGQGLGTSIARPFLNIAQAITPTGSLPNQGITNVQREQEQALEASKAQYPFEAGVGETAGLVAQGVGLGKVAPFIKAPAGLGQTALNTGNLIAQAGALGAANVKPGDDPLVAARDVAALAAAISGSIFVGGKALKPIIDAGRGTYAALTKKTTVDTITEKAIKEINPDLSKATLPQLWGKLKDYVGTKQQINDALYAERNNLAEALKIKVPVGKELLSFAKAEDKVSSLYTMARRSTDGAKAQGFIDKARQLQAKIDESIHSLSGTAGENLKLAHSKAKEFFRTELLPWKQVKTPGTGSVTDLLKDMAKAPTEHVRKTLDELGERVFIANVAKKVTSDVDYATAYAMAPEEIQQTLAVAHLKAKHGALGVGGTIDLEQYAKTLRTELTNKSPLFSKVTNKIDKLAVLIDKLDTATNTKTFQQADFILSMGVGGTVGAMTGGPLGGLVGTIAGGTARMVPKWYSLGKALNDGIVNKFMNASMHIAKGAAPTVSALIDEKISKRIQVLNKQEEIK